MHASSCLCLAWLESCVRSDTALGVGDLQSFISVPICSLCMEGDPRGLRKRAITLILA